MTLIGIDPGESGGMAFIADGDITAVKFSGMTEHDIADRIRTETVGKDCFAMIEHVWAFPRQGASSTFKFGRHYGFLRGLLVALAVPFESVSPAVWQRSMRCLSGGDKNVTKARAQQLYPHVKLTHATADAVLIATYAKHVTISPLPPKGEACG